MDWITGIQKAIDYTEDHLEEEIDFEKVAEEACSSSFQFQRIFTADRKSTRLNSSHS